MDRVLAAVARVERTVAGAMLAVIVAGIFAQVVPDSLAFYPLEALSFPLAVLVEARHLCPLTLDRLALKLHCPDAHLSPHTPPQYRSLKGQNGQEKYSLARPALCHNRPAGLWTYFVPRGARPDFTSSSRSR